RVERSPPRTVRRSVRDRAVVPPDVAIGRRRRTRTASGIAALTSWEHSPHTPGYTASRAREALCTRRPHVRLPTGRPNRGRTHAHPHVRGGRAHRRPPPPEAGVGDPLLPRVLLPARRRTNGAPGAERPHTPFGEPRRRPELHGQGRHAGGRGRGLALPGGTGRAAAGARALRRA